MTLKISISGVRGIAGESLTDDVVRNFAKAFSVYLKKGRVVIGSDTRLSGKHVKDIVISELCINGFEVIDIGIAPTPTTQLAVRSHKAKGGIVITASHNPPEWNGLKFIRDDGIFLNEQQAGRLIKIFSELPPPGPPAEQLSKCFKEDKEALDFHISSVIRHIDAKTIRKKVFKVAIDCCNGAGSVITKGLLRELGCEIIAINTDIEKEPPRGSEPVPQNLASLCKVVRDIGADIGFAQDPDADRLSIVSDKGIAIGEEYSLALAVSFILSRTAKSKGNIVVANLSTSRMIDDIARKYGAKVLRTKVGEVNVSEKMKETGAVIGGEGNGGIIWPSVGFGRDSLAGIGLILDYMSGTGKNISDLAGGIPSYTMIKDKISLSSPEEIDELLEAILEKYSGEKLDRTDGVKIDLQDGWAHIRASNTEPVVRIIAEGKDASMTKKLVEEIKALA